MSDHELGHQVDGELLDANYSEGFSYLYTLFSHLTSSKSLFVYKLYVLMELSSEISRGSFTRADIEAIFPQYPARILDSVVNSLIDGTWLVREEGTLQYAISRQGLLAIRFFPFLYRGDEMDELAFQNALQDIFQVAEQMNLNIRSLEMLRDQAIHAIQRNIAEIRSALVSRNTGRIREALEKMERFIQNIAQLLGRLRKITEWKRRSEGQEADEKDKNALDVLNHLQSQIKALYDEQHKVLSESLILGTNQFTKSDIDRFLYGQSYYHLAGFAEHILFTPSNAKWVDEDDIVTALNVFMQRVKHVRKRTFTTRVFGYKEEVKAQREQSYLDKVKISLSDHFEQQSAVQLDEFLFTQRTKTDTLMYLAALCFLDGQPYYSGYEGGFTGFDLNISKKAIVYENQLFKTLSEGHITKREM